ncbi:MAG: DUF1080 domain-containing protein [Planctomycetota bacterium]|nr:DUF1080 domain-containing protein [Planctomycetota bacterium]MDA1212656.1 DUF1080 domain-containing protein [Planctomycetota bacterium]
MIVFSLVVGCGESQKTSSEVPETTTPVNQDALVVEDNNSTNETSSAVVETKPDLSNVNINLTADEIADGWISLFDGVSLFGWEANSETNWQVVDGAIVAAEGQPPGLLVTQVPFADYVLKAEAKLSEGGNSGIFLRTAKTPTNPAVDCYELNICDTHPAFATGSLVARVKPAREIKGDGRWLPIEIRVDGPQVTVMMDGEQVLDYSDETEAPLANGYIGLQMNGGRIEFRNLAIQPLGLNSIWNGDDLTDWRVVPESKTEFVVEEKELRGRGGLGFLETEQMWGNFVLQFAGKVNIASDNSGIFFRSQTGTDAKAYNGYELQIQNDVKEGDISQPANFGTGAIFRRAEARRVTSKDFEWFYATLVANESQFMVWVNGELVTSWKDDRTADENPRKGLRLDPGHLAIQAHDPTSDISFRDLKIVELPKLP